ncbi:MAG: hypothetical protein QOG90_2412 [Actinomycetota bacterium]|jgi:hypothetical protein
MKRTKPNFQRLAERASEQDNVVTRKQLLALGFSDKRIARMLERRLWTQLQRGVYLLAAGPATWRQRAMAAQWAGGESVALDAGSALMWRGIDGPEQDTVELVVTTTRGNPEPRDVTVRHPSRAVATRSLDKVRVVGLEDALLGFAAQTNDRKRVEIAVESALLGRHTSERKIWAHIASNSRRGVRGVALLRSVMQNRPNGKPARSILELEVIDLLRSRGIPLPDRNVDVIDANGDRREIDLCYLDQKGAIEADSRKWHSTATQTAEDSRRQAALEAVGFEFVRVTWPDVFQRPDWVVAQVQKLLLRVVAA